MRDEKKEVWQLIAKEFVEGLDAWKEVTDGKGLDVYSQLFIQAKLIGFKNDVARERQQYTARQFQVFPQRGINFDPRRANTREWAEFIQEIDDLIQLVNQIEMEERRKKKASAGPTIDLNKAGDYLSRMKDIFSPVNAEEEKKDGEGNKDDEGKTA